MELENHTAKLAYIQMLHDTLKKKLGVLDRLMEITKEQEDIIASNVFLEDEFLQTITLKEEQLQLLVQLDTGFEKLYESVKSELTQDRNKYTSEIIMLKEAITAITDQSVKLQAMEQRNKSRLEVLLSQKHREIRKSKLSSETASRYYKTMTNQQEAQSYFYDKKK